MTSAKLSFGHTLGRKKPVCCFFLLKYKYIFVKHLRYHNVMYAQNPILQDPLYSFCLRSLVMGVPSEADAGNPPQADWSKANHQAGTELCV